MMLDVARSYHARGWMPIPVPHRSKDPSKAAGPGWQNMRLADVDLPKHFNGKPSNVGILLGEPSGWLVDIDLDHALAVELADHFLPATAAVFGRPGKPRSHRLFRLTEPAPTKKWKPKLVGTVLEFRSTGCQTVFPGSTHESGEAIAWDSDGEPAPIAPDELLAACQALADEVYGRLGIDTKPEKPASSVQADTTAVADSYAANALAGELRRVLTAPRPGPGMSGGRNDALFLAARNCGELTAAGLLDQAYCESQLATVAAEVGLSPTEARKTIASGMTAGLKKPRDLSGVGTKRRATMTLDAEEMPEHDENEAPPEDELTDELPPDDERTDTPNGCPRRPKIEQAIRSARCVINGISVMKPDGKEVILALSMREVVENIFRLTGDWPRRVGNSLFVHDARGVNTLDSPASLFGWFADRTGRNVQWHRALRCIGKEECHEQLKRQAIAYLAVETMPHFPPLDGHYYAHDAIEAGNGEALRWLVNRFCPATDIDSDLLTAAFVTPAWGGPCGARPAFLLTADEGRGVGKSKAAEMVGHVHGGFLDVALNEDIGRLKERLLSPEGRGMRVMRLDNVKTLRFSWAEFEALLTAPTISGRQLYVGEGRRPNTLTTLITLNGASLSTDMAQRVVPIKLSTPRRTGDWESETLAFIQANRERLIADIAAFFSKPPQPLGRHTRWAAWERDVLARLPEPNDAQKVIGERRDVADVEHEEAEVIVDYFAKRLREHGYRPDDAKVHIPSNLSAAWTIEATGEKRMTTTGANRHLGQLIDEGRLPCLLKNPSRNRGGRGFIWWGEHASHEASVSYDL